LGLAGWTVGVHGSVVPETVSRGSRLTAHRYALGETIPGSRAPAPDLRISRAVPQCDRREAVTAQPHPVRTPVTTGGGTVLTAMSQPMAR
jgi:hypothetical protein